MDKENMKELNDSKIKKKHKAAGEKFSKYFPHLIKKVHILNAPTFFYMTFKAVSWMFSKKKKERLNLLGGDYLKVLDKEYGLENLPKCIGGTNSIPLGEYDNFWQKDLMNSFNNKTLGPK
jgi:hypothetical protein